MKVENEITVLVTCSHEELHNILISKNFQVKDSYKVEDVYMIDSSLDIKSMDKLDVLKRCFIIRNIFGIKKEILYKYKKYAPDGTILEQAKIEIPVADTNKAINFMESLNYRELFTITDMCTTYADDKIELIVQHVEDDYILIEVETEGIYTDIKFNSVEEIIETLDSYDLPYVKGNYFVKKAERMLEKTL